ncbi:MAG: SAM-dependent methyltransferase [Solirubrobacteraceae bacterium]
MSTGWMTSEDFEQRYRSDPDPWNYTTSGYEREKYAATLEACGPGPSECALELGGSIGVFSAMLAPRCRRLLTIDAAPTAVAIARERLAGFDHVEAILGEIPSAIPARGYDLVLASEILYYLDPPRLEDTLELLTGLVRPGARVVAVHWSPPGPERPFDAEDVHGILRGHPSLRSLHACANGSYLLDVLEPR